MARRFRVEIAKIIWGTIEVELEDNDLPENPTQDEVEYTAIEAAQARDPRLCAQCCGWGDDKMSISDDDEWGAASDLSDNLKTVVTELKEKK